MRDPLRRPPPAATTSPRAAPPKSWRGWDRPAWAAAGGGLALALGFVACLGYSMAQEDGKSGYAVEVLLAGVMLWPVAAAAAGCTAWLAYRRRDLALTAAFLLQVLALALVPWVMVAATSWRVA